MVEEESEEGKNSGDVVGTHETRATYIVGPSVTSTKLESE